MKRTSLGLLALTLLCTISGVACFEDLRLVDFDAALPEPDGSSDALLLKQDGPFNPADVRDDSGPHDTAAAPEDGPFNPADVRDDSGPRDMSSAPGDAAPAPD